jgi:hypothetical protein
VSLLRLSGIVRSEGGVLRVRNRIYERVFDAAWVAANMPDAELRRQRAAYRQGLWRAIAASGTVMAITAGLALAALNQARRAEEGQRALRRHLYVAQMNVAQRAGLIESRGVRYTSPRSCRIELGKGERK